VDERQDNDDDGPLDLLDGTEECTSLPFHLETGNNEKATAAGVGASGQALATSQHHDLHVRVDLVEASTTALKDVATSLTARVAAAKTRTARLLQSEAARAGTLVDIQMTALLDRIEHLETQRAQIQNDLWKTKETNAKHVQLLAQSMMDNVQVRHGTLGESGIDLHAGLIIKPEKGSLGLEIRHDPFARYKGVRVSNVSACGVAAGAAILDDDVIIAVNGQLVLGCTFDEVIDCISESCTVVVMSLAKAVDVDARASPFWDMFDALDEDDDETRHHRPQPDDLTFEE